MVTIGFTSSMVFTRSDNFGFDRKRLVFF